jgi:hypothetical protein
VDVSLCDRVVVNVYDGGGTLVLADLDAAHSVRFTDELGGDGAASLTVNALAPDLVANPDLLEDGIVKFALELVDGDPTVEVSGAVLVPTSGTVVADPGLAEVTSAAPGLRGLLNRAVVFPEVVRWDTNTEDARLFGWMSIDTAAWYDPADWSTPLSYGNVDSTLWANGGGAALITADLTPAVGDVNLFRTEFTLATASRVRIYWLGDDSTQVFLNSKKLGEVGPGSTTQVTNVVLPAGSHTLAAQVTNEFPSELKFAAMVFQVADDGSLTLRRRTDTTHWKVHKVIGGVYPGWTAAAIFLKLLQEAKLHTTALAGLDALTADFTNALDSNGDPWPDIQDAKAFQIGTPLGEATAQLEELGFHLRVLPDMTVQAFIEQGTDVSATVELTAGVNLLGLTYQGSPVEATTLLYRGATTWGLLSDTTGVATYGNRYKQVTLGTSQSYRQALNAAAGTLPDMAEPKYVYTARFRAVDGAVPWLDFGVGDTVSSLDRTGTYVPMRMLSLSAETPSDVPGPVIFTAELEPV